MSIPILSSPNLPQKSPFVSLRNTSQIRFYARHCNHRPQFRSSPGRIQPLKSNSALDLLGFSAKPVWFSFGRKLGFITGAENGEGESKIAVDEAEEARGQSTMPSRFRYLTKEVPDRPVRWPWLIALAFSIYAWRTVLWELSNWKKALFGIANFVGYLLKLVLGIIFSFIGHPITSLIRCIETALYTIRSIYSGIVTSAPVPELTVIIMLTSTVLAMAETAVPNSVTNQTYLLAVSGIISFAAVMGSIPELLFWLLLVGLFCYSRFVKKRDEVSSVLPVAAALAAVGEPWVRVLVMALYLTLVISHHSKKLSKGNTEVEVAATSMRLPAPLLVAALVIGIHVGAKWLRYRHLTWMIK
ncbi:hypothetical protein HHK36_003779 [Tetracentron sinense]|uniref:Uncharacterized protein n=1 Tax=Tetracentron sinense TaxID=13715 RepID=A0A834ZZ50_TETSI|nr:hypothetical protein HHK36_003779 [Tetracentron sinense]